MLPSRRMIPLEGPKGYRSEYSTKPIGTGLHADNSVGGSGAGEGGATDADSSVKHGAGSRWHGVPHGIIMQAVEPLQDNMAASELLPVPAPVAPNQHQIMLALERRRKLEADRRAEEQLAMQKSILAHHVELMEEVDTLNENASDVGSNDSSETSEGEIEPVDSQVPSSIYNEGLDIPQVPVPGAQEPEESRLVLPVLESLIALRQRRIIPKSSSGPAGKKSQPQPPPQRQGQAPQGARSAGSFSTPKPAASNTAKAAAGGGSVPSSGASFTRPPNGIAGTAASGSSFTKPPIGGAGPQPPPFPGSWRGTRKWTPPSDSSSAAAANPAAQGIAPAAGVAGAVPSAPTSPVPVPVSGPGRRTPGPSWAGNEAMPVNMALSRSYTFGYRQANGTLVAGPVAVPAQPPQPMPPSRVATVAGDDGSSVRSGGGGGGGGQARTSRFAAPSAAAAGDGEPTVEDFAAAAAPVTPQLQQPQLQQQKQQEQKMLQEWQEWRLQGVPMLAVDESETDSEDGEDANGGGSGGGGGRASNAVNATDTDDPESRKGNWRRARRITQCFDDPELQNLGPQGSLQSGQSSALTGQQRTSLQPTGTGSERMTPATPNGTGGGGAGVMSAPLSPMASRRVGNDAVAAVAASAAAAAAVAVAAVGPAGRSGMSALTLPLWLDKALGRAPNAAGASGGNATSPGGSTETAPAVRVPSLTSAAAGSGGGGGGGGGDAAAAAAPAVNGSGSSFTSRFMRFRNRVQSVSSHQLLSASSDTAAAAPASPKTERPTTTLGTTLSTAFSAPSSGMPPSAGGTGPPAISSSTAAVAAAAAAAALGLRVPVPGSSNDGRSSLGAAVLVSPASPPSASNRSTAAGHAADAHMPYMRPGPRSPADTSLRGGTSTYSAQPPPQSQTQPGQQQGSGASSAPRVPGRTSLEARPPQQLTRGRFSLDASVSGGGAGGGGGGGGGSGAPHHGQGGEPLQMMVTNSSDWRRGADASGWHAAPPGLLPPVRLL